MKLFLSYRQEIFASCLKLMGGHQADAEEALSRVAMIAFEAGPVPEALRDPKAWLMRLAYHHCMSLHRRCKRLREDPIELLDGSGRAAVVLTEQESNGPEKNLLRRELLQILAQSIRSLPDLLREPLLLRIAELSYREMADLLARPEAILRKQVQTAREILRRDLEAYLELSASGSPALGEPPPPMEEERPGAACRDGKTIPLPRHWHPVRVELPDGMERTAWVLLDELPSAYTAKRHAGLLRYLASYPSGWRKRLELADILLAAGRLTAAVEQYRHVLARRGLFWQVCLRLGDLLTTAGRYREAAELFARTERSVLNTASRSYLRGAAELARGRPEGAIASLRRAVKRGPGNPAHGIALGRLLLAEGRPAEALDVLRGALRSEPLNGPVLLWAADALQLLGQPEEAMPLLERAVAADAGHVLARARLIERRCLAGLVEGEEGRRTEAHLEQLEARAPELSLTFCCAACLDLARGHWETVLDRVASWAAWHPNDLSALLASARLLGRMGRADQAAVLLKRGLASDPENDEMARVAVAVFAAAGRRIELLRLCEDVARGSSNWRLLAAAARALAVCGDPGGQARELSQRALGRTRRLPVAFLRHGEVLARTGHPQAAMEALETGLRLLLPGTGATQSSPAALLLGQLCRQEGKDAQARHWYEQAAVDAVRARVAEKAASFAWEAEALAALGQWQRALPVYCSALACGLLDPARGEVLQILARGAE